MFKILVGIQGGVGSTNEKACKLFARKHGWQAFEIKHLISTDKVLDALEKNEIRYGVFAWKSSNKGLVFETQRSIQNRSYEKIDEKTLQLDHALLYRAKINNTQTVRIYSHPQALKEHESFLREEFPNVELIEEVDTAVAAQKLKDDKYPKNSLVIAPITCANIYGLRVHLQDIPTNKKYFTTFYLVQKKHQE